WCLPCRGRGGHDHASPPLPFLPSDRPPAMSGDRRIRGGPHRGRRGPPYWTGVGVPLHDHTATHRNLLGFVECGHAYTLKRVCPETKHLQGFLIETGFLKFRIETCRV